MFFSFYEKKRKKKGYKIEILEIIKNKEGKIRLSKKNSLISDSLSIVHNSMILENYLISSNGESSPLIKIDIKNNNEISLCQECIMKTTNEF